MHTTLPHEARVGVEAFDLADNLVGLVQGVFAAMDYVLADERPEHFDFDELLCASAVAFKNYVYEPQYNQLEDPQLYSTLGEWVCNYGPFEAISYFSGWDVKEFNGIARNDFWKLLQFEIASGRPVTTLGVGQGEVGPVVVVGYCYEPRHQTLDVVRPGLDDIATVDVTGVVDFQLDEPSFTNWMLIARPSEQPEWASSHTRQRLRALRWAAAHARRGKEFSQETRENYAPGLAGFDSFLDLLNRLADGGEGPWGTADGVGRYVLAHVDGLVRARRAAAKRLPVWAAAFVSDSEYDVEVRRTVVDAFAEASRAYEELSDRLGRWLQAHRGPELGLEALHQLRRAYTDADACERTAVGALERGLQPLPRGL